MTGERNTFRDKNLALAKPSTVLCREMRGIQGESKIVRQQRNILQGRPDDLEDKGIDIGEPRNDLEVEARFARRRYGEKFTRLKAPEGSDESSITLGFETNLDFFQGVMLETELQNATDEMADDTLEKVKSQNQRERFDSLFSCGSKEASEEDSNLWSPKKEAALKNNDEAPKQGYTTSHTQCSFSFSQINQDTVYRDHNGEDIIGWTEGNEDEHQIDFPDVHPGEANHSPVIQIPEEVPFPPKSLQISPALQDNQSYDEKLELNQAESDLIMQQRDRALAELKQTRRELATRTAERNGARQRMQLLDEEIAERETREVQLKEELRLAREEDPLADKLFVELHEIRKKHEELEEEQIFSEDRIKWLQQEIHNANLKSGEDLERIKYLESVLERNNGLVENLEHQIETAQAQLISMSTGLNARQLDVQRISTELETVRNNFVTAQTGSKVFEASLNATREERNVALAEVKSLAKKVRLANEQRNSAKVEARDLALEHEKAVAAIKTSNQVTAELRRSLNASSEMAHRLQRISAENTRELVMIRDQRDSALYDISKLTRDLMTSRGELSRLQATIVTLTEERNRARTFLMAITDNRDSVLKERSDLSQQLEGQNQRLEDLQLSVRRLGDENEKLLKTQEDLRRQIDYLSTSYGHRQANETQGNLDRQIHDLLDAHERGLAKVEQNVQSESIQPTKTTLIDASVYNPLGDSSQAGDVPGRPHSPALFVNNTPVTPGFLQSHILAPKPAARKSKRSTRNPAPAYVDPPSPSTPKQSRKRKPASAGKDGPNKK